MPKWVNKTGGHHENWDCDGEKCVKEGREVAKKTDAERKNACKNVESIAQTLFMKPLSYKVCNSKCFTD